MWVKWFRIGLRKRRRNRHIIMLIRMMVWLWKRKKKGRMVCRNFRKMLDKQRFKRERI